MSAATVTGELRAVLDAPRGRRFSRPGASPRPMATPRARSHAREQHLLAQMKAHPNAVLPFCSPPRSTRTDEPGTRLAEPGDRRPLPKWPGDVPPIPRPWPAPDDGPPSPRPRPERPPLSRRPRSHRKPRRRRRSHTGRHLLGYVLATAAGALAHHLVPLLS